MVKVQSINIDELPCRLLDRRIDEWSRWRKDVGLPKGGRLVARPQIKGAGIDPVTLLREWRRLERRTVQLRFVAETLHESYWQGLKTAAEYSRAAGCNGDVWISEPEGTYVNVFDGKSESMTTKRHDNIVENCIQNPEMRALILSGSDLARMQRLKERQNTWYRRYGAYLRAFQLAIELRLHEFVESMSTRHPHVGMIAPPCAFMFSNEGRRYMVVTSTRGREFEWFDGTLFQDDNE